MLRETKREWLIPTSVESGENAWKPVRTGSKSVFELWTYLRLKPTENRPKVDLFA